MEPFYFGKNKEIFGMFHPAEGTPLHRGILISGPLLAEGIRAQFALRQIALRCAASGYDVMRFDYVGLGNSRGRTSDVNLEEWSENVRSAAEELSNVSGSKVEQILAVRFAANLIAPLTQESPIKHVVLWDPVLTGEHWLEYLLDCRRRMLAELPQVAEETKREFMGHVLSDTFVADLRTRTGNDVRADRHTALITNHYTHLSQLKLITSNIDSMDVDCQWQSEKIETLYPPAIVEAICNRLT